MTVSSTAGTGASPPLLVNGLISGINTQQVIQALLQSYQIPITNLQDQQSTLNSQASDYQTINTDLQALLTAAEALNQPSSWNLMTASSSDQAVATATASPGATAGSLGFTVDQLAQSNILASAGTVSSQNATVTSASSFLVAVGAPALGFSGLAAAGGLAAGSHQIEVTQSSAAATVTGTALPASTTITTGSNDTLTVSVGGTAYTLTLAAGTYSPSQLASAVQQAATAASAPLDASVNAAGQLTLSSTEQGSSASLSVTGGTALSALGLTSGQAGTGTDAIVTVDGTATTLSAITPGQQVSLAAPTGSITATVASAPPDGGTALVAAGSASASVVSSGNGSLSQVVSNIDNAGLGVSAQAVQVGAGQYILQVAAGTTGLAGAVTVDPTAFSGSPLDGLTTIAQAQDAKVTVGGSSGYSLTSGNDTFANLLPGTSVTVTGTGSTTVSVAADATGEAGKVSSLVSSANQVLSDIQSLAGYDAATKTGGPLMGSAVLTTLQQQVLSIFGATAGTSNLANAAGAGITLNQNGSLTFDQSAFEAAFAKSPSQVTDLFVQGGTFSPSSPSYQGQVSLLYAANASVPGSYAVSISHSATQATDTGAAPSGGTISTPETLTITSGGQTANYTTTTGESLSSVASGLNAAFSAAGLGLSAQLVGSGTQLQITSAQYGSAQSFTVTSTANGSGTTGLGGAVGTPVTFTGTDVAGTINGVAATGDGQVLTAPASDPTLAGLAIQVTTPGISSATNLGTFTYTAGVAQQLASLAQTASNPGTGSISSAIAGLTNEATGLNSGIAMYQQMEASQQKVLQNEFATMEATLGTLKNESSLVSSQLSQLPGF
ncbi:MAG: flagellar filament capping protein FliD [Acidimicrobiales bacterium]